MRLRDLDSLMKVIRKKDKEKIQSSLDKYAQKMKKVKGMITYAPLAWKDSEFPPITALIRHSYNGVQELSAFKAWCGLTKFSYENLTLAYLSRIITYKGQVLENYKHGDLKLLTYSGRDYVFDLNEVEKQLNSKTFKLAYIMFRQPVANEYVDGDLLCADSDKWNLFRWKRGFDAVSREMEFWFLKAYLFGKASYSTSAYVFYQEKTKNNHILKSALENPKARSISAVVINYTYETVSSNRESKASEASDFKKIRASNFLIYAPPEVMFYTKLRRCIKEEDIYEYNEPTERESREFFNSKFGMYLNVDVRKFQEYWSNSDEKLKEFIPCLFEETFSEEVVSWTPYENEELQQLACLIVACYLAPHSIKYTQVAIRFAREHHQSFLKLCLSWKDEKSDEEKRRMMGEMISLIGKSIKSTTIKGADLIISYYKKELLHFLPRIPMQVGDKRQEQGFRRSLVVVKGNKNYELMLCNQFITDSVDTEPSYRRLSPLLGELQTDLKLVVAFGTPYLGDSPEASKIAEGGFQNIQIEEIEIEEVELRSMRIKYSY